jgi:hypothetical protein
MFECERKGIRMVVEKSRGGMLLYTKKLFLEGILVTQAEFP